MGRQEDEEDEPPKRQQKTLTSVVYFTLEPTFTDEVVGYSTASEGLPEEPTPPPKKPAPVEPKVTPSPQQTTLVPVVKPTTTAADDEEDEDEDTLPTAKTTATNNAVLPSETVDDIDDIIEATVSKGNPLSQASSSSSSTAAAAIEDAGMSGGAKAGLAIGIVAAIGLLAGLIFFFVAKKRKQQNGDADNEKFDNVNPGFAGAGAAGAAGKHLSTAPRLDVRPTTAFFMPNRASQMAKGAPNAYGNQMSQRPMNADNNSAANPFGNHAATIDPVNAAGPSVVQGVSAAGVVIAAGAAGAAAAGANKKDDALPSHPGPAGSSVGAVITGPVRSTSRGGQSKYTPNSPGTEAQGPFSDSARTDGGAQGTPQQVQNTTVIPMPLAGVIEESGSQSPKNQVSPVSPITPATGQQSSSSPVAPMSQLAGVIAAGGAANLALYRVHLDFSPSMPDELAVKAGEIVRLLKEFDDGWCKCVSDDLKREGVLPRTCISNRPIRRPDNSPRNGPPGPMGPNGQRRQSPPNGNRGPPMNNNGRSSPAPGQNGQFRPQQRGPGPMGPGGRPQGQMRPMSPAMAANGRNSPGPQYRPQQGRPMSPAMGPNTPRGNGTPRNGPGPMSGPPMTPTQGGQQARRLTPPQGPPAALQAGIPSAESVAHIAANFPLPGSPTTSIPPSSPTNVEFKVAVPEVIITASPSVDGVPTRGNSVVKKVTVGRKPLPGSAQ